MDLVLAAQLGDPGEVVAGHDEDQIGAREPVAREEPRAVVAQVEPCSSPTR